MLPKQIPSTEVLKALLPVGTCVYLTDISTTEVDDNMVSAARKLRDANCQPIPHLAARRFRSRDALEQKLAMLTQNAGVTDVLVIAGSVNVPRGPYGSSMDLLRTGLLDRFGIADFAVAGHPEGAPDFAETVAMQALYDKQEYAKHANARMRIVTQFGFDSAKTLAWADNLRVAGIEVPVHLGVAGPAKLTTIVKYAALCGVGNSVSMLTKRASGLISLATGYQPDTVVKPVERALTINNASLISQMHIFPFGGLDGAAAWLRKRGSW
jgi:methylenetetrahydrofolate reductase (NADPH)